MTHETKKCILYWVKVYVFSFFIFFHICKFVHVKANVCTKSCKVQKYLFITDTATADFDRFLRYHIHFFLDYNSLYKYYEHHSWFY